MNRRHFATQMLLTPTATAMLLGTQTARAQGAPAEGREFTRLREPQPVQTPGKFEVIEFFSYACPHCNAFEPELEAWAHKLPPDVVLRRVPVSFLFNAPNFQRTYYALEAMGLVDAMQRKIFAAVHVDHQQLAKPEEAAAIVSRNGGDGAKFISYFNSFSVATAANRAKKMTSDYGIDSGPGVPALVVQGRWLTSPAQAHGTANALAVVDALVQKARKG